MTLKGNLFDFILAALTIIDTRLLQNLDVMLRDLGICYM
uniref:Uncharacterized protein n=1 Tax=Lepeophtheirus salmonis TaxID=72036 RepID=A0A0K2SWD4_LEPSM